MAVRTADFPREPPYFGPPPKSGELTPYAAKVLAQLVVILASLIFIVNAPQTWGKDYQSWYIAIVILVVVILILMVVVLVGRTWIDVVRQRGGMVPDNLCCSPQTEITFLLLSAVIWAAVCGVVSSARWTAAGIQGLVQVFSWFGLGASLYAAFKAHQHRCDETEYSEIHFYELQMGNQSVGGADDSQYR